jgi:hypothetical protein
MANIKSFPNNQDVYIGAEDVMKWLHGRTSGVFAAEGNASVSALVNSTMAVTVSDGIGWMSTAGKDGIVWWIDNEAVNGSKLQMNIDPADGVLNRIDRIIVEWKTTNYVDYPEVKVLKGTASSKATAPALTNSNTLRQISLARISVAAGTTAITSGMITDERLNPSVCGLVTESVKVDTSTINAQFEELLERVKKNLQQITDGQILNGSVTVPKLADETIKYISLMNLLDNSDFTQFVAQAGVGCSHGTKAYAGDRWILSSGSVTGTANANGNGYTNIKLNGTISQKVSNPPSVGTAAVEMVSGTATISYKNGEVTVTSSGGVIKNVRLFEGSYAAANVPAYRAKGYGAELAECQRYYIVASARHASGTYSSSGNKLHAFVPTPVTMRTTPTANILLSETIVSVTYVGGSAQMNTDTVQSIAAVELYPNGVKITVNTNSSPGAYTQGAFYGNFNIELAADL